MPAVETTCGEMGQTFSLETEGKSAKIVMMTVAGCSTCFLFSGEQVPVQRVNKSNLMILYDTLSPELSGFFAPGQKSLSLKEQPHEIEIGQYIIFLDWEGFLKEAVDHCQ